MAEQGWQKIAALRELAKAELEQPKGYRITVGMATCGISAGADLVYEALLREIQALELDNVKLELVGCIGMCTYEPVVEVFQAGKEKVSYVHVDPEKALQIVNEHLARGIPALRYTLKGLVADQRLKIEQEARQRARHDYRSFSRKAVTGEELAEDLLSLEEDLVASQAYVEQKVKAAKAAVPEYEHFTDLPFYQKQKRVVLRNCGFINPEDIREYLARDGYLALEKVLSQMTPPALLDLIKASGLRGRGGAGFPTGLKWQFAYNNKAENKYFICNADEGDPGAFMDRSVLEGDPHAVLEAMAIGAYAIGARQGYVYVRAEYPTAVKRLELAIKEAHAYGLLGENIMGSGFDFAIELRLGAGAFVCGEETALIASIEGERGLPRHKPPYPAESGLWQSPTVINNVETLANIAAIVRHGAEWFRSFGTASSPGTKVFALGGKISNTGLVEVPMGISLREIIEEIGGGCPNGRKFKAVQTGGPSGGCLPLADLDLKIDFDTLKAADSMMGSGGMIVMDEDNCMVDIARFYLDFTVDESCGQCVPCREGTLRMLEILGKITEGHAEESDLLLLRELAEHIQGTSLCALGQTAPNPVLSTLKHFAAEYEAHVKDKQCPAHVCRQLVGYLITADCVGCTKCARLCPVGAISGQARTQHTIDLDLCTRCGTCVCGCAFGAIIKR